MPGFTEFRACSQAVLRDLSDALAPAATQDFDPKFNEGVDRVRWQVFRKVKARGLVAVMVTNADRVYSSVLGC